MIMDYDIFYVNSLMMIHDQTWYGIYDAKIIILYTRISRLYMIKAIGFVLIALLRLNTIWLGSKPTHISSISGMY